ncbi:MAG: NADH-quinone oxidoreductase subunit J [Bacteroidales bacterium]|nr:NADH-quinone oxidoreductase subunit J [Bacteroidales bacterium]
MTFHDALFLILATASAVSALGVVVSSSIIRSAIWLLFMLMGVSGLYFFLGAEFLGAAQLIVYVGGTMVLVVFGGMLTTRGPFDHVPVGLVGWVLGGGLSLALFALLVQASLSFVSHPRTDTALPGTGPLGLTLLGVPETPGQTAYLLPFEIVSIHLLVVLIAAAYLARAKRRPTSTHPEADHG